MRAEGTVSNLIASCAWQLIPHRLGIIPISCIHSLGVHIPLFLLDANWGQRQQSVQPTLLEAQLTPSVDTVHKVMNNIEIRLRLQPFCDNIEGVWDLPTIDTPKYV